MLVCQILSINRISPYTVSVQQFPTRQEGQIYTVLSPMPTIDEFDQLDEKTEMVSVNPDEDRMNVFGIKTWWRKWIGKLEKELL